ncbi:hypothetical protein BACI349Y_330021 [Bacillus sp. 349Y]|nr:hypothetical protein BACI349Y_330021 [Bacillus sp. 349Y]
MERKALDSCGKGGKVEIPQAQPRKLDFLPAESKRLQRKGTDFVFIHPSFKKCKNPLYRKGECARTPPHLQGVS